MKNKIKNSLKTWFLIHDKSFWKPIDMVNVKKKHIQNRGKC